VSGQPWGESRSQEEFPNLLEALPYFSKQHEPEWAFEFAVELLIGGMERMLEEKPWLATSADG
jgi:hypothetical protein